MFIKFKQECVELTNFRSKLEFHKTNGLRYVSKPAYQRHFSNELNSNERLFIQWQERFHLKERSYYDGFMSVFLSFINIYHKIKEMLIGRSIITVGVVTFHVFVIINGLFFLMAGSFYLRFHMISYESCLM